MLRIINRYKSFINIINSALDFISVLLMLSMCFIVTYQVVMRYVFSNTPSWTEEVALIMVCWFVYLGAVIGLKEDLHIGIEMFVSKLPKKVLFAVEVVDNLLILGLSALFMNFGFSLAWFVRNNSLPATGLSVAVYYYVIGIAGILMTLVVLGKIAEQLIKRRENDDH